MKCTTELEARLFNALLHITKYASPEYLRRNAEKLYGLGGDEAIEMAYENVVSVAKIAIKGVRKPKVQP